MLHGVTKPQLQAKARLAGLKPTGTKANIIRRLKSQLTRRRMHRAREPYASTRSQSTPPQTQTTEPLEAPTAPADPQDLDNMAYPALQGIARERGLNATGTKAKLLQRLRKAEEPVVDNGWAQWVSDKGRSVSGVLLKGVKGVGDTRQWVKHGVRVPAPAPTPAPAELRKRKKRHRQE